MNKVQIAINLMKKASYIVAFTGAGVSVESGIPDFRSPGGLWERFDPMEYANYSSFLTHPEKFWTMHSELSATVSSAKPNPAHLALAKLEKLGKLKAIITQNVDFLHQRAGNTRVLELHGSGEISQCIMCKKEFDHTIVDELITKGDIPPLCDICNGLIKPNVILFGEPLPWGVLEEARRELKSADLLIIIGSSLSVYPAASLPHMAIEQGIDILIINEEPTNLDNSATVVFHSKAGLTLPPLVSALEE
ncbi:MAG: Sir2 family NAD-dependent protein deacetylase [Candidatus Heimdallarchaeota archaeon]|nr:Sir2 family NAD-dependent protein deacetylase [Candidatus Heimdallarchaeota archaeon]